MKKFIVFAMAAFLVISTILPTSAATISPTYSHRGNCYDCRFHANCENCKGHTYCSDDNNNDAALECYTRARFENGILIKHYERDTGRRYGIGYSYADTRTQGGAGCCVVNDYTGCTYYGPGSWDTERSSKSSDDVTSSLGNLNASYRLDLDTGITTIYNGVE